MGSYLALLPPSRSKEMDYFKGKYCGTAPKVSFMQVLIDAIRSGKLDLKPDADSGWYDYQVHALETLLVPGKAPESDHLLLTAAYKKKLVESFKSIITQTRETHVKQLETGSDAVSAIREVDIYPNYPVEPFPTFYLRQARAYRFVGTYLEGVLGAKLLSSVHRLYEDGQRAAAPLDRELEEMTELLYGLYVLTSRAVGLPPEKRLLKEEMAEFAPADCVGRARQWLKGWKTDRDILADPRVITPIWNSDRQDSFIYWAVLGVKVVKVSARYVEGHEPEVVRTESGCRIKEVTGKSYFLLMEQMEQVKTPRSAPPPTRKEFRKLCDKHKTRDAIVDALASLGK
jgi:hypothetical protein